MFQLTTFTKATLNTLTPRSEKHGDDDVPAVSIGLEIETANTLLDLIDPTLREALFKPKPDAEPELDGVEQSTPVLRSNSIDSVKLPTKHEGWTLGLDHNGNEDEALRFGACKVDKMIVEPPQGGSIVLKLRVGTSDIDAERMGYLGVHVGQDIWVKLTAPEKKADDAVIDGTVGHPGAANAGQGSLLDTEADGGSGVDDGLGGFDDDMAAGNAGAPDGAESASASKAALDASGHSPFPKPGQAMDDADAKAAGTGRRTRKSAAAVE